MNNKAGGNYAIGRIYSDIQFVIENYDNIQKAITIPDSIYNLTTNLSHEEKTRIAEELNTKMLY